MLRNRSQVFLQLYKVDELKSLRIQEPCKFFVQRPAGENKVSVYIEAVNNGKGVLYTKIIYLMVNVLIMIKIKTKFTLKLN